MATIKEQFNNLNESDQLAVWQLVCDLYNLVDDQVFVNDEEFFNVIWDPEPFEVARSCTYGDYHYQHGYVRFDGYGNLESSNDIFELIDDTQIYNCVEEYPHEFADWFEFETDEEE